MNIFLLIFLVICSSSIALASYSLAPWVPTRKKDLERISQLANLKAGEVFYDLGCGDGRVAIYINDNYQAKAIGLELALPFYLICKMRQLFSKNKNLSFKFKNLFKENLSKADAIYIFAQSRNKLKGKIIKKLKNELKTNARVITYAFPIEGWQPVIADKPAEKDITIYLYKIDSLNN